MSKLSIEAYKQAMKDIREDLRKEGRSFITVSRRQLLRREPVSNVYCSSMYVHLAEYKWKRIS